MQFLLTFGLFMLIQPGFKIVTGTPLYATQLLSRSYTIYVAASNHSSSLVQSHPVHLPSSPTRVRTSLAPTRTSSPATISTTSLPACTRCLLEALNPQTLTYPSPIVGDITITTATVYAYPTYYPDGTRLYTIISSTVFVTEVLPSNQTSIATTSWSTFGATL